MSESKTNLKITINISSAFLFLYFFIILWVIIGFIAFITSIICFCRSGSLLDKIIGLLLALLFGPLYFIFYIFEDNYCR
jgi:hypothetical protein